MLPRDHRLGTTPEPNLLDHLAAAGRRAPDGALAAAAGLGLVAAILPPILWPAWWLLALPGAAAAGFGLWGIADRTGTEWRATEQRRNAGQAAAVAGGLAAAAGLVAAVLFVLGMVYVALAGVIH